MDLTPKKYQKKPAGRRRKSPRIVRNWNNPLQITIILISVVAFIGTAIYERVRDRHMYEVQFDRAVVLADETDVVLGQVAETYSKLQDLTEGEILKSRSEPEQILRNKLRTLTDEIDSRFMEVETCFNELPARYRDKRAVQQWFVAYVRRCIDSALGCDDVEQARLWYNAARVRVLMSETRARIEGKGSLTVNVDDQIEQVVVIPVKSDGPRMVPCDPIRKGTEFPLEVPEIERGSYLLWGTRTNGIFTVLPIYINHGEDKVVLFNTPPDAPEGMGYVPAGAFYCGGTNSPIYRLHQHELPAFFIRQHEVTVGEYLEFWKSLDDPVVRAACMSRIQFEEDEDSQPAWNDHGELLDDRLHPDYAVVGISHAATEAYCDWLSGKLNRKVRLPTAFEWEKAARGVDGRTYPWGYGYEPTESFALVLGNLRGKQRYPLWAPPGKFRRDSSIYGMLDMAGNVREMTSTPMPGNEDVFQIKGGSAFMPSSYMACANVSDEQSVPSDIGFRYIMELTEQEQ